MKIAYIDCFSGISGNMVLGAFVNAGLPLKTLEYQLARLRLPGYTLSARKGTRGGLQGTYLKVTPTRKETRHRTLEEILGRIERSRLPDPVKANANLIFTTLGKAEARVHGLPIAKVHFHEVGAVDSIVDIVGAAIAFHEFEIDQVVCSPIALGSGTVVCDHGALPVPVPAVMELLRNRPTVGTPIPAELTTPTGAAIAVALSDRFGPLPAMTHSKIGYGLGSRDNAERPNALRLIIGHTTGSKNSDQVVEIVANLDDQSPEIIGSLFERFLESGALDVYTVPIQMKKNRPAIKLAVIARPADIPAMEAIFFEETSTFGIRTSMHERKKLSRSTETVQTRWGKVVVVCGSIEGRLVKRAPEYEACREIARKKNIPLQRVYAEVVAAMEQSQ